MTDIASTPSSNAALDAQALSRLRELDPTGANRLLERVASAFLSSVDRLMPELQSTPDSTPSMVTIRNIAHTLKSSSASIGGLALSQRCAELEQLAHAGRAECLGPVLDAVHVELEYVRAALKLMLAEPESL